MDSNDTNNIWREEYEERKRNLPVDLTPEQYEIAICEIVDDLGI